jgi:2-polyprenyl-6-methoxyphenol hydroxylase-like FAD-dependent oxidoreductase
MPDPLRTLRTRCCIVGGGPAGMLLGFLLGRAGVDTLVLEKHADFLRDFRGDTVHPSTLALIDEMGLLARFLARPHQRTERLSARIGGRSYRLADFTRLSGVPCRFLAFMPQWDFLDFLADEGAGFPSLRLLRSTEATGLLRDGGRVTGVTARDAGGALAIEAGLTVGCDGRSSTLRAAAGLAVETFGAPMDVLWFRIARDPGRPAPDFITAGGGGALISIDRGDYWQCALVIPKGGADAVRGRGLDAFRAEVARLAPPLAPRIAEVASWDDVKLLSVAVDRLASWSLPGLLMIGDAAHAMSPIGGVGINLALQDAVAAANALAGILRERPPEPGELEAVRQRRLLPTRVIQGIQVQVQDRLIAPLLSGAVRAPLPLRLIDASPWLQGRVAALIGLGIRREHLRSPEAPRP